EGPPGMDFKVALHGGQYNMEAHFLTDLDGQDALKVRAKLNTRRLYGYSERELPLYEEDAQGHSLQLNFDEGIVLLPFGRKVGDDKLKIEITPLKPDEPVYLPSGKRRPLEINIIKQSPGGIISIKAFKKPHHFIAEVALLENGREVAVGTAALLLQDEQDVI